MAAPDVINPEVLSSPRRLERIGQLQSRRTSQAVDDLLDAHVRHLPTLPLLPAAWTLRATTSPPRRLPCRPRRLGVPLLIV
jgi:predicted nucleic acid-binding protein